MTKFTAFFYKMSNARSTLRQKIRHLRNAIPQEQQIVDSQKLSKQLTEVIDPTTVSKVALYLANDGEVSTRSFIKWCWQNNIEVYLPVLHPFAKGHLIFLRYCQTSTMVNNKYGIEEPALNATQVCPLEHLDVVFTPLVAFDNQGNRLGMGGGYYDRTFADPLNKLSHIRKIGLAHDCQLVDHVPCEAWDVPLPEIATPSQLYHF